MPPERFITAAGFASFERTDWLLRFTNLCRRDALARMVQGHPSPYSLVRGRFALRACGQRGGFMKNRASVAAAALTVRTMFRLCFAVLVAVVCASAAQAQTYPSKVVKLIVPQGPGGATD